MGNVIKLLLVELIRLLIVNAGVVTLVIIIVRILGDTGLCIGQVSENRPVAEFEQVRIETGPETLGFVVSGRALS